MSYRAAGGTISASRQLLRLLSQAYSGERAAALAYAGHARAAQSDTDRAVLLRIEADEWHHRTLLLQLMSQLGGRPSRWREATRGLLGWALGRLCAWTGELAPTVVATRLEARGVAEYATAARIAVDDGLPQVAAVLRRLGEIEAEHQRDLAAMAGRLLRHGNATIRAARTPRRPCPRRTPVRCIPAARRRYRGAR